MKLLYVTSLSGRRINGFMRSAILAARQMGIDFTLACNMSLADADGYAKDCEQYGIRAVHIDFVRNPIDPQNLKAYHQLLGLMKREKFDAVHCNTPIGGLLGRLCAQKARIPFVIYMAHGFHFWEGAPVKNWMLYYPIERLMAHATDLLVTINHEDNRRAKKFHLRKNGDVVYIPGVGVELQRFTVSPVERQLQRVALHKTLNIPDEDKVYISVGEVNQNKGHETAIRALSKACLSNWRYLICGDGEYLDKLKKLTAELKIAGHVQFLGYCSNIPELLAGSDCFVFPSYREGLPAALMEAMASGLPCIASRIRGAVDLLPDSDYLFKPGDVDALAQLLQRANVQMDWDIERVGNLESVKPYDIKNVIQQFCMLYRRIPPLRINREECV